MKPYGLAEPGALDQIRMLRGLGLPQTSIARVAGCSQAAVSYRLDEPPPPVNRKCAVCPLWFWVNPRERRKRKFCSAACKQRDYQQRTSS